MNRENLLDRVSKFFDNAAQQVCETLDLRLGGHRLRQVLDDAAESTLAGDVTTEQAFAALSLVLEPDPITGRLRGDLDTLSFEHKSTIRELLGIVLHAEGVESTKVDAMKSLTDKYGASALQELLTITDGAGDLQEICISDFGALPPITTNRFNKLGSRISVETSESGVKFLMNFNGEELLLKDAWAGARAKVFNFLNNAAALPGFGALDIDNVTPFAQAIWDGLGLLDGRNADTSSHIVDIGAAGYGSTSMMILSLLDAKLAQTLDNSERNIVVHLVDPSFDETVNELAKKGLLRVESGENRVDLSATTKSYLPPESMRPGHLLLRLCQEHPELVEGLKAKGVEIVVHNMGSDEFFEKNLDEIRGSTILSLVDGNHGGSTTTKEGQKKIQPLNDTLNSLQALVPGGRVVFDDNKATPNVGLVQVTIDTIRGLGLEIESAELSDIARVNQTMGSAFARLRENLGARVNELIKPQFANDPKSERDLDISESDAAQLVALSEGLSITEVKGTPVVVMVKP